MPLDLIGYTETTSDFGLADSYNTRGDEPTSPRNMFAREHEVGRVLRSPEFRSLYMEDA